MLDDLDGRQGEPFASDHLRPPGPSRGSGFVAPLTIGRPGWQRRYAHSATAIDAAALASVPILHLLWSGVVALPLLAALVSAGALAVAGCGSLRVWLHHLRHRGRAMSTLLVVGTDDAVVGLVDRTRGNPSLGWRVGGACTSTGTGPGGASGVHGVPVVGDLDSVGTSARNFDAVAVCPTPGWTVTRLQQLAWDLDRSRTELLVDPRLVRRVGCGVRIRPVPELPLLRMTPPTLDGPRRLVKESTDRLGALLLLLVVAPVLLSCALAVRRDGGPALVGRTRVGRHGRTFSMLSFRTTVVGEPTTTPVGRVLHRHCLDELPQLLNVVGGSMALVGPRPLEPGGSIDERDTRRRLLVKPGITGLYPIAGSDELSVEDVALTDVHYVESWSPALDARIVARSVRAALDRSRTR